MIELSNRYRIPGIFDSRDYPAIGGFMSYGPKLGAIFRRLAAYVDRILQGEAVGELPIEQPTELVVNLKTANVMGLTLPAATLVGADDVIE